VRYVRKTPKISALYEDRCYIHLIVVGDFNCDIDYSFFYTFKVFTADKNLCITDINKLCDAFTYNCSDSGSYVSWIHTAEPCY